MIASFTQSRDDNIPLIYQPNPLVNSEIYREWNQNVQLKNNVNTGEKVWCHPDQILSTETESLNQKLTGLANPKTLVEPTIEIGRAHV
jgi:hypothetical protein